MSDIAKTGLYVAVASVLLAAAFLSKPDTNVTSSAFDDTGEVFFPEFTDPLQATALEVFDFDEETGRTDPFRVEYKDNRWTIPSHHNYPADAKDRLAKTAGSVIGLSKDAIVSDQKEEHAELGVVDPQTADATAVGVGRRIKLFDKSGNALADLIVGKDAEGFDGFKYMRAPDADRVYRVKADSLELSTKFADWIDTDLLELDSFDIDEVTLKDYEVDIERRRVLDAGETVLAKNDESKWELKSTKHPLGPKEEFDESKASQIATAVADLKIVGVREKPEGLKPDLRLPEAFQAIYVQQMANKGFYVSGESLYSNSGEALIETKDGLVYTLRFGGVIVGEGEEVTAGSADEKAVDSASTEENANDENKEGEEKDNSAVQKNRYLLVSVSFNEDKFPPIEEPKKEEETKDAEAKAKDGEEKEEKDAEAEKKAAEEAEKKAKEELEKKREDRATKIKEGKEKAQELTDRYAKWYYVIPNDAFEKIRLSRKDLVKEKEEEEKAEEAIPVPAPPTEPKESKPAEPSVEKAKPAEKKDDTTKSEKPAEPKPTDKAKPEESKPADEPVSEEKKAEPKPKAEKKAEPPAKDDPPTNDEPKPEKAEEKPAPPKEEAPKADEKPEDSDEKPESKKD